MASGSEPFVFIDGPRPSEAEHIYDHFFADYPSEGYDETLNQQIHSKRFNPNLQGSLFYDELLSLALTDTVGGAVGGSFDISTIYPPKAGREGLCTLIDRIASSNFDRIRRTALLYYLTLDLDAYHGVQYGIRFAKEAAFPRSVRNGMKGYWHLDNGQYRIGISYLEQPDFVPRIARILSPLPSPISSERDAKERAFAFSAFLKLIDPSKLAIDIPDLAEANTVSLCWTQNLRAAWLYCRTLITSDGDEVRERVQMTSCIARIVEFCFMPKPKPAAVKALISLPLTASEEDLLSHIIVNPPTNVQLSSNAHATAIDILLGRYINSGMYIEAILLDRRVNSSLGLMQSSAQNLESDEERQNVRKLREKRQGLVRAAYSVLTRIERLMLDLGEDSVESPENEDRSEGLDGPWERIPTQADETGLQDGNVTSENFPHHLTPLTASPVIRKPTATGHERVVDPLLAAVMKSSPARLRGRISGAHAKVSDLSMSGASPLVTGSPLSRSFAASPSAGHSLSLRESIGSLQGTPSKNKTISRVGDISISSPLATARPYRLGSSAVERPVESSDLSIQQDESRNLVETEMTETQTGETVEPTGPLARLAQQLEEEAQRNQGSIDEILRRSVSSKNMSPFRISSGSDKNAHSALFSSRPVRRYEARYELGNKSTRDQEDVEMQQDNVAQAEQQEPVRRRGRRPNAPKQKASKMTVEEGQEDFNDGDTSVPGSFPGVQEESPVKSKIEQQKSQRKTPSRKRAQKVQQSNEIEDERVDAVPEMTEVSTSIRKSRSAASNLARPKASTPLRRSARLSVEPDAVHDEPIITPRPRSKRSASPTKKSSTAAVAPTTTRKRRGASQAPTEPSDDEKEAQEQNAIVTRSSSRRKNVTGEMPGGF